MSIDESQVPDRVAVETPRGHVRTGDVVDVEWEASVARMRRLLVVDVEGARLRVPESEAAPAASA